MPRPTAPFLRALATGSSAFWVALGGCLRRSSADERPAAPRYARIVCGPFLPDGSERPSFRGPGAPLRKFRPRPGVPVRCNALRCVQINRPPLPREHPTRASLRPPVPLNFSATLSTVLARAASCRVQACTVAQLEARHVFIAVEGTRSKSLRLRLVSVSSYLTSDVQFP